MNENLLFPDAHTFNGDARTEDCSPVIKPGSRGSSGPRLLHIYHGCTVGVARWQRFYAGVCGLPTDVCCCLGAISAVVLLLLRTCPSTIVIHPRNFARQLLLS